MYGAEVKTHHPPGLNGECLYRLDLSATEYAEA